MEIWGRWEVFCPSWYKVEKLSFDSVAFDYSYPVLTKLWQAFQREMSIDGFPPFTTPISLCPSTDTRSSIQSETFRRTIRRCFSVSTIPEKGQYFLQIAPPRNVCKRHRYLSTMRRLSIMNNGRTGQVLSRHFTVSSSPHLLIIKISTTRGMTLFVKWIERRDKVESKMRWILRINSILFFSFFFLGLMNGFLFYLFLKGYYYSFLNREKRLIVFFVSFKLIRISIRV